MKWQEVRLHYPKTWVLIEALKTCEQQNNWIVDDIAVINQYDNVMDLVGQYSILHKKEPQRDVLVVNTQNKKLDIKISHSFGLRYHG